MMETVGIVDLGSNSVRLAVTRIQDDGGYRVVAEVKAVVRLAGEIGPDGAIGAAGLEHTLAVLRDFQRVGKAYGVGRYIGVATAAVRQAKNGAELVGRVSRETGIELHIIPGTEEGELGLTGALNTIAETDGLLIDIGGGSTELVRFSGRKLTGVVSLPYGAVNLTASFLPDGSGGKDAVERLERFLADVLMTVPWLPSARGLPLIGVGGSVRNLGRIDQRAVAYPLGLLHNYRVPPERVAKIYRDLRSMSVKERRKVPGLSDDRADIIMPAVAMIQAVLARSGAGEMAISGTGLREGLLYRHLLADKPSPVVDDVLSHSVANMVHIHGLDERLAREMSRVALALYDGLQPLHGFGGWARRCLSAAAGLAQAGSTVNVYGQDQHTFYLLTRGRLHGLSHREIVVAGAAAGFKSPGKAAKLIEPFSSLLRDGDEEVVRRLGVLTAMARELTRYEPEAVQAVDVDVSSSSEVEVRLKSASRIGSEVARLEALAGDFRKAWGRSLSVTAVAVQVG